MLTGRPSRTTKIVLSTILSLSCLVLILFNFQDKSITKYIQLSRGKQVDEEIRSTTKTKENMRFKPILPTMPSVRLHDLSSNITKIIHQSWKSKTYPSKRMARWAETWKACFPDWEYILWTDSDNRNLIKTHYPWFLERYDSFPQNIMRVDVVRYFYMHHYGGIYADLDTECVKPFLPLLNASIVLGAMSGHWIEKTDIGHIQNSFMYSDSRHPFWLEVIMAIFTRSKLGGVEDSTGPLVLMRELAKYKSRGLKDVMVYPGKYFNPFSWLNNKNPNCKVIGQMNDDDAWRCKQSFKEAYVIQYHTKTWAGGTP